MIKVVLGARAAAKLQVKKPRLPVFVRLITLATFLFSIWGSHAYAATDISFPSLITTDLNNGHSTELQLTGYALRKKLFLDIYTIAHYSDQNYSDVDENDNKHALFNTILSPSGNKQITMKFQRNLRAKQIRSALTEGVKKNCVGEEINEVRPQLAEFLNAINADIVKDDEFSLLWTDFGHLLAFYQGELVGDFDSPLLAKLLWSMWFSKKAVVDREKLIEVLDIADSGIE